MISRVFNPMRDAATSPAREIAALLSSTETNQIAEGLATAAESGDFRLLPAVARHQRHPVREIASAAAAAVQRLSQVWVRFAADNAEQFAGRIELPAILFRQVLRWLMRSPPDVRDRAAQKQLIEVLAAGLAHSDWEVRMTAILAAGRLRETSLLKQVRAASIPSTSREGLNRVDRRILGELRRQVLRGLSTQLRGGAADSGGSERDPHHLRSLIELPVAAPHERVSLWVHALTEPVDFAALERSPPPASQPIVGERGLYRLARAGLAMQWIPPIAHWLGGEPGVDHGDGATSHPIRPVISPGFFIARSPLTEPMAQWLLAGGVGAPPQPLDGPHPSHLCTKQQADRLCEVLGRVEGAVLALTSADLWEMACRGPDGRRFPWGNGYEVDSPNQPSPWGVWRAVGMSAQWTSDESPKGRAVICGATVDLRCCFRRVAEPCLLAAVRPVLVPAATTATAGASGTASGSSAAVAAE